MLYSPQGVLFIVESGILWALSFLVIRGLGHQMGFFNIKVTSYPWLNWPIYICFAYVVCKSLEIAKLVEDPSYLAKKLITFGIYVWYASSSRCSHSNDDEKDIVKQYIRCPIYLSGAESSASSWSIQLTGWLFIQTPLCRAKVWWKGTRFPWCRLFRQTSQCLICELRINDTTDKKVSALRMSIERILLTHLK